MAENYTPQYVSTFTNDTTAVSTVNNNFTAISTAFLDVLSRIGVQPNQMGSTLDMNNNQIINLPFPATANSPARLADLVGSEVIITNATTGNSGHTVPFLDGSNTWSGPNYINISSFGFNPAFQITWSPTGAGGPNFSENLININDAAVSITGFATSWQVTQQFGSSTSQGGRIAIGGTTQINSATNVANAQKTYIGVSGLANVNSGDNGTSSTSYTNASGNFLGGLFQVVASGSATNLLGANALSASLSLPSGSSTWQKTLLSLSCATSDVVTGSIINAAIEIFNEASCVSKWSQAILIDNVAGQGVFPVSSSGDILKATAGTVGNGINFSGMNFNNNAFVSPGFQVTATGGIVTGASSFASGLIQMQGTTSGFGQIQISNTSNLFTFTQPVQIGVIGTTGGQLTLAGSTSGSGNIGCTATGGTLTFNNSSAAIASTGGFSTTSVINLANTTAVPSGGSTSVALYGTVSNIGIFFGTGSPTVSAPKGSLYLENGSGQLWINQSGTSTWVQITVP